MYYGLYRSSTTTVTGCVKEFVTTPQTDVRFASQVNYLCDLCKVTHAFRFAYSHLVNTPRQKKQFDEYCSARGIERDVEHP